MLNLRLEHTCMVTIYPRRPLERSIIHFNGDIEHLVSCLFVGESTQAVKGSFERRYEVPNIFTVALQNFYNHEFTTQAMRR